MTSYNDDILNTVDALAKAIDAQESQPCIINDERVEVVRDTYKRLRKMFRGSGVDITCQLHEPFKSMGSICLIGTSIECKDSKVFAEIIRSADATEVYPLTDGRVKLDLTFRGLTVKIKGKVAVQ